MPKRRNTARTGVGLCAQAGAVRAEQPRASAWRRLVNDTMTEGRMRLFAVYYDKKRLTKPGTEYEARMDLLRLQAMFLNLHIRECGIGRAKARMMK